MRAKKETQFVLLKLIYVPPRGEKYPPAEAINQKLVVPPNTQYPLRAWIDQVAAKERLLIPRGNRMEFSYKEIKVRDLDLFTIYHMRFHKLLAIIGEEKIHWVYYVHKPIDDIDRAAGYRRVYAYMKGTTPLTVTYCPCCITQQYLKFVESILYDNHDPNYSLHS